MSFWDAFITASTTPDRTRVRSSIVLTTPDHTAPPGRRLGAHHKAVGTRHVRPNQDEPRRRWVISRDASGTRRTNSPASGKRPTMGPSAGRRFTSEATTGRVPRSSRRTREGRMPGRPILVRQLCHIPCGLDGRGVFVRRHESRHVLLERSEHRGRNVALDQYFGPGSPSYYSRWRGARKSSPGVGVAPDVCQQRNVTRMQWADSFADHR